MRGRTLDEKRYGPGFRPGPVLERVVTFDHCAAEPCADPVAGSIELYVDDVPPALDWYTRILAKLTPGAWTRTPFCIGHMQDVVHRSLDMMDEPDLWAPGRASPPVLQHPPKLIDVPTADPREEPDKPSP